MIQNLHHFPGRESKQQEKDLDFRIEEGKSIRKDVPRKEQSLWKVRSDRKEVLEILVESDEGRIDELISVRHKRMAESPFCFFRGLAALMAKDLSSTPSTGLLVHGCGDSHIRNFGGFATPERNLIFDINDFDESLPCPWEWDLKRLIVSGMLAGHDFGLPESKIIESAFTAAGTYRKRMRELAYMSALDVWYRKLTVEHVLEKSPQKSSRRELKNEVEKARSKTSQSLLPKLTQIINGRMRIIDNPPLVYHPRTKELENELKEFSVGYYQSVRHDIRVLLDRYRLVDAAMKAVGIGSVGTNCAVALLMDENDNPLFLQFKEARQSVLERYGGMKNDLQNQGERVVKGQRIMQAASDIFLGWSTLRGRGDFYFRQLRDMKISLAPEKLSVAQFSGYLRYCAQVLAQAHARSGDSVEIAGYAGKSDEFEKAITEFSVSYAKQTEKDYSVFRKEISSGHVRIS